MNQPDSEKFIFERHPTMGEAAGRRVREHTIAVPHHPTAHETPLMQGAEIGQRTSVFLMLVFLGMIVAPGGIALLMQMRPGSGLSKLLEGNATTQDKEAISSDLLEKSAPNTWLKRTWGSMYARASGDGMGNVWIGNDNYLFYRDDIDSCIGSAIASSEGSPAIAGIVDYNEQLKGRGIHLILLPVPAKPAILPWEILSTYDRKRGPAHNPGYRGWIKSLGDRGVDVVDMTDSFWQLAVDGESPYLRQDSHWTPHAWAMSAQRLAERAAPYLGTSRRLGLTSRSWTVLSKGDLVELMGTGADNKEWPPEVLKLTQVLENGSAVIAHDEAQVLLLGDSFSANFNGADLTGGGSSGLAEQIMLRLGMGVQVIAGSGRSFPGGREILSQRPEALRQKKVVIWEFTARVIPGGKVPLPDSRK
jgi:hypothetical protein